MTDTGGKDRPSRALPPHAAALVAATAARFGLTAAETDVLACLARGLSTEGIAEALFLSVHTIRTHLKSVMRKLGVNSRAQALAVVLAQG